MHQRHPFATFFIYVTLVVGTIIMLFPLSWMILTSLKTFPEVLRDPPGFFPEQIQWVNYKEVFTGFKFHRFLLNSAFVTAMTLGGTILSCCAAAYAFAFLRFRYRGLIFGLLLTSMMLPGQVTVIPMFKLFVTIGWVDTFLPLVVPPWLGTNVFAIFLLRQFFLTIPYSYIEAARLDGASEWRILWSLVVPMSLPVVVTISLFTFLGSWNDLFGPLIYLHSEELYTLPIGLLYFISQASAMQGGAGNTPWHLVMALATVMVVPVMAIFFLAQKQFIAGLSQGGAKG
jgi:multiple sugar transport system permease protein